MTKKLTVPICLVLVVVCAALGILSGFSHSALSARGFKAAAKACGLKYQEIDVYAGTEEKSTTEASQSNKTTDKKEETTTKKTNTSNNKASSASSTSSKSQTTNKSDNAANSQNTEKPKAAANSNNSSNEETKSSKKKHLKKCMVATKKGNDIQVEYYELKRKAYADQMMESGISDLKKRFPKAKFEKQHKDGCDIFTATTDTSFYFIAKSKSHVLYGSSRVDLSGIVKDVFSKTAS